MLFGFERIICLHFFVLEKPLPYEQELESRFNQKTIELKIGHSKDTPGNKVQNGKITSEKSEII